MADLWGRQYREENQAPRYPFADQATLLTADGLAFGPDVLLDASLYPAGAGAVLALTSVVVSPDARTVTLWVGDEANTQRASAAFDPIGPPASLPVTDPQGRPAGLLVADPLVLTALAGWPAGTHTFPAGSADFVASCVIPTPEAGLRALVTPDGTVFSGDVWLVGQDGVVLSYSGGNIRVDVVGDPLFTRRACAPGGLFTTPNFLRSLNNVGPDLYGNFNLIPAPATWGQTALRITPEGTDTLRVSVAGPAAATAG